MEIEINMMNVLWESKAHSEWRLPRDDSPPLRLKSTTARHPSTFLRGCSIILVGFPRLNHFSTEKNFLLLVLLIIDPVALLIPWPNAPSLRLQSVPKATDHRPSETPTTYVTQLIIIILCSRRATHQRQPLGPWTRPTTSRRRQWRGTGPSGCQRGSVNCWHSDWCCCAPLSAVAGSRGSAPSRAVACTGAILSWLSATPLWHYQVFQLHIIEGAARQEQERMSVKRWLPDTDFWLNLEHDY